MRALQGSSSVGVAPGNASLPLSTSDSARCCRQSALQGRRRREEACGCGSSRAGERKERKDLDTPCNKEASWITSPGGTSQLPEQSWWGRRRQGTAQGLPLPPTPRCAGPRRKSAARSPAARRLPASQASCTMGWVGGSTGGGVYRQLADRDGGGANVNAACNNSIGICATMTSAFLQA